MLVNFATVGLCLSWVCGCCRLQVYRLDRSIFSKIFQANSLLREAFTGRLEPQLCSGCSQTPTFSFASLLLLLPNAICPVFRAVRPHRDCRCSCISWLRPCSDEIRAGTIFFISCALVLRGQADGCVEIEHSWL